MPDDFHTMDEMTGEEFHDPGITLENVCTPQVLQNLRDMARVIYRQFVDRSALHQYCAASCRRKRKCLYLQPVSLEADEPDHVEHNLRERDMPLCMASMMDEDDYHYFRRVILTALR